MLKRAWWIFLALGLAACESIETKRPELAPEKPVSIPNALKPTEKSTATSTDFSKAATTTPETSPVSPTVPSSAIALPETPNPAFLPPPPKVDPGERPKIALLLGPGGLRTYAHIGVLEELMKAKLPVVSVVGFETSSLVAGIFAAKGQPNAVEWQMMKLHEEDFQKKSLMTSTKPQDVKALVPFMQNAFGALNAEDTKINFACPSYNFVKRQVFMMSHGPMLSLLPYCIPFIPFYKPHDESIAALTSLAAAIRYAKSKGANYLIYVDLLSEKTGPFFEDKESDENVEWATVAAALESQLSSVNRVISVPLNGFYINDFSKRREMSQKGQEAGRSAGKEITNELGL